MCALDAAEITAVSFLGEVGEEAHHALSKMSAAKAIAGGENEAPFLQSGARGVAKSIPRAFSVLGGAEGFGFQGCSVDSGLAGTPASRQCVPKRWEKVLFSSRQCC